MTRILAALALWLAAALAAPAAEPLPDPAHTSVNDFAAILSEADTRTLDEALIALHDTTGVEGTVVTLPDRSRYGTESLEAFALRLFNHWGVGDRTRNDGFMVLMIPDTREARIELGAGYAGRADDRAKAIMNRVMLPLAREGQLSAALREGTLAVIAQIAEVPQPNGITVTAEERGPATAPARRVAPPAHGGGFDLGALIPFAAFGIIGLQFLRRFMARRRARRCPQCGGDLVTVDSPTGATLPGGAPLGEREVMKRCPSCGWRGPRVLAPAITPARYNSGRWSGRHSSSGSSSSGGGFGGGRGGGGGASGRW